MSLEFSLHLVDCDPAVHDALRAGFAGCEAVQVTEGDLLAVAENTVVSPANAYGFMDGGIDALYLQRFGPGLQRRLHELIARLPHGYLPVGEAVVIETRDSHIPWMIVAPTLFNARDGSGVAEVERAMAAILRRAHRNRRVIRRVYCPGLGTGVGRLDPERAAQAMAAGYQAFLAWRATVAEFDATGRSGRTSDAG